MIKIGIFLPHQFASFMAITLYDYLQTANGLADQAPFQIRYYAETKNPISYTGLRLPAETKIPADLSMLIFVGTGGSDKKSVMASLRQQAPSLCRIIAKAKSHQILLAATCTSSFYLAASGLLNKKNATTAWWLAEDLKKEFPQVLWNEKKSLVAQGRLITTGAGFTGLELAKLILRQFKQQSLERRVHQITLLPEKTIEQFPYLPLAPLNQRPFAQQMKHLLEKNWNQTNPDSLARALHLSPRTFMRRFKEQMEQTPGRWLQGQRIEKAKELLRTGRLSVEETCYQVGYQDPASFNRLFQREVGLSPGEFRTSFAPQKRR